MYYRKPKEYLIPVVIGDITEEDMNIIKNPLKEEDSVEKIALEEADKEFVQSQAIGYFSEGYEYF